MKAIGTGWMAWTRPQRWFRFSLSTFLCAVTLLAVWIGMAARRANMEGQAVAAIERIGGTVRYDFHANPLMPDKNAAPPAPKWLCDLLGVHYFSGVACVMLNRRDLVVRDSDLVHLRSFPELKILSLMSDHVTDAGLESLSDLNKLETLYLAADITDKGLVHLHHLNNLEWVGLAGLQDDVTWYSPLSEEMVVDVPQYQPRVSPGGLTALHEQLPNTKIFH